MAKNKKKGKKQVRYISNFAMQTANGVWGAIGHGVEAPVHLIATAVQIGIEAGVEEARILLRTPQIPPPPNITLKDIPPPKKNKKEKK